VLRPCARRIEPCEFERQKSDKRVEASQKIRRSSFVIKIYGKNMDRLEIRNEFVEMQDIIVGH
jgi:hypothetical protein